MNPVRMLVVGTGALGRHHSRILSQMPGVNLVAVADSDATRGEAVAAATGTRWVADYRSLLDSIDAAVVAVPTVAHRSVAGELLQHRIPVLVEKPLANTLESAIELVEIAENTQTVLQVGHIEQFNPAFVAAKPTIRDPRYIRAERYSPFAFRSMDIGVVHDVMIHDIELVLSLVQSELKSVHAFGVSLLGDREDCVQARLTFANGCIADLAANRVSPATQRTMQVWSEAACTQIDFAARTVNQFSRSDQLMYGTSPLQKARQPNANIDQLKSEMFGQTIRIDQPAVGNEDALTAELADFVQAVRGEVQPRVNGTAALRAMQAADRILNEVATHQWDASSEGRIGPMLTRSENRMRRAG